MVAGERRSESCGSIFVERFDPDVESSFDRELDRWITERALELRSIECRCNICNVSGAFVLTSDVVRETVACPADGCIGRYRAIAAVLAKEILGDAEANLDAVLEALQRSERRAYLTETNTSIYRRFKARLRPDLLEVSEYFGDDRSPGELVEGVRHENLEATSFGDAPFDLVLTSEVMEHVPNAVQAEREIVRLLRPGGLYAFTVPLDPWGPEDIILSERLPDGTIKHYGEPVYHGDPRRSEGILAYRIFSVRGMRERFRALGCELTTYRLWSKTYGIIGDYAWVHVARKATEGDHAG